MQQVEFLYESIYKWKDFGKFLKSIEGKKSSKIGGLSGSRKAHFVSSLANKTGDKILYIAPNDYAAFKLYEDFSFFNKRGLLLIEPAQYMLYDAEAKSLDTSFRRLRSLERLVKGDWQIAITSINALMQRMPDTKDFIDSFITLSKGMQIGTMELSSLLVERGYKRVSKISMRGELALRGDIFDIFPSSSESAYRIEFFDKEIERIREVDINSQRSLDLEIASISILPSREVFVKDHKHMEEVEKRILASIERLKKEKASYDLGRKIKKIKNRALRDIGRLSQKESFPGYDRYIPFILNDNSLFDYIGPSLVVVDSYKKIWETQDAVIKDHYRICESISDAKGLLPETYDLNFSQENIEERLENRQTLELTDEQSDYYLKSMDVLSYKGQADLFAEEIQDWIDKEYSLYILVSSKSRIRRMEEFLIEKGIGIKAIKILVGGLSSGFEYPELKLALVTDSSLTGFESPKKRRQQVKGQAISSFADIKEGDYVVHDSYGIGIFQGLETIEVDKAKKDYIRIKYAGSDSLFLPTDQLSAIQKYIGPENTKMRLHKLGGVEWKNSRARVKESLRIYAKELIELYARRKASSGYAFTSDTNWQKEFEEGFIYEETEGQIKSVEEIKADMEDRAPMDRLLCGDVGYGKTEVALRAAFKAVCDNKQVAFLVPTTVLAQQHYVNFLERFKDFPVRIEHLSRFRTSKERERIVKELRQGVIDIVVGTHSIIAGSIKFKDLGLLIVDEEQRFGVNHKEQLKKLWPNVDVLTLSATPIPRTLHMSLSGIRDISIIQDPPNERYPVQTYVMEWEESVIKNAIYREMGRQGQVFYLYNRVRTINEKKRMLEALVPEARIVVAHGQMTERKLEETMLDFARGEYDILLCTTIIESGLDIPNVNTVIVEDAQRMGLAQLYQIRGRVGRSDRLAYAYITYKKDKNLNEQAEKRLNTIREFTEFGSGFKIALRDLEIRGAGSVLGEHQHGQLGTVGYEMYCRLLNELVKEEEGKEEIEAREEAKIDLPVDAYIDSSFIKDSESRLSFYKKIASIETKDDVNELIDELIDIYGYIPENVNRLIEVSYIRALANRNKFTSIVKKGKEIVISDSKGVVLSLPVGKKKLEDMLKEIIALLENILLKEASIN